MTKKEYEVIGSLNMTDQISNEAYYQIMIVAEDEPEECGDCISRQAVLDLPRIKTHSVWGNVIYESVDVENVRQLPSVTPQQKMGRWIIKDGKEQGERDFIWWKCSECGQVIYSETEQDRREYHAYCGMCGCKMQEVENGKDND